MCNPFSSTALATQVPGLLADGFGVGVAMAPALETDDHLLAAHLVIGDVS